MAKIFARIFIRDPKKRTRFLYGLRVGWDSKDGRGPASMTPLAKGRQAPCTLLCSMVNRSISCGIKKNHKC